MHETAFSVAWQPQEEGGCQRGPQTALMPLTHPGLTFLRRVRGQQADRAEHQAPVATGFPSRAVFPEEPRVTGLLGIYTYHLVVPTPTQYQAPGAPKVGVWALVSALTLASVLSPWSDCFTSWTSVCTPVKWASSTPHRTYCDK